MRNVSLSPQNSAETIWKDKVLSTIPSLQTVVKQAITLDATRCPPFMWRNLSKQAYDLVDDAVIKEAASRGVAIKKRKRGLEDRVANCKAFVGDHASVERCIAHGADKWPYVAVFRKGDRLDITWYK